MKTLPKIILNTVAIATFLSASAFSKEKIPTPAFESKKPLVSSLQDTLSAQKKSAAADSLHDTGVQQKQGVLSTYRLSSDDGTQQLLVLTKERLYYSIKSKDGESTFSILCSRLFPEHGAPADGTKITGIVLRDGMYWAVISSPDWPGDIYEVSLTLFGVTKRLHVGDIGAR
jgi:hypothetical protein